MVGAKIVTNAKTPGSRCYGYVTMLSADDATVSMQNLNKTELDGRMISVERVSIFLRYSGSWSLRSRNSPVQVLDPYL